MAGRDRVQEHMTLAIEAFLDDVVRNDMTHRVYRKYKELPVHWTKGELEELDAHEAESARRIAARYAPDARIPAAL